MNFNAFDLAHPARLAHFVEIENPPQRRSTRLAAAGVAISMDGRGRFMDNILSERLRRSIKYEKVHLKAYAEGREARAGIGAWMTFYNDRRPHQTMNNKMPMAVPVVGFISSPC